MEYFKKRHKETYIPKGRFKRTAEEKKEIRKKYYEAHREYYQEKNREYHLEHKNDESYRQRRNKNTINYYYRNKKQKIEKGGI